MSVKARSKKSVMLSSPMGRVTDDRVGDVREVTTNLMTPSGDRDRLDETVARGWILTYGDGELDLRETAHMGDRLLRGLISLRL